MANILVADEAARIVVADPTDTKLLDMLPQIDAAIQQATGRDWAADTPVNEIAKRAATFRLAVDYDLGAINPQQTSTLERAYVTAITQLQALAAGFAALADVNGIPQSAADAYVKDMLDALQDGKLGLSLRDFNRLALTGQRNVAKSLLSGRPAGGYPDAEALQAALDAAVRTEISV